MAKVKDEYPGIPHKDIMGLLAKKYRDIQASKSNENAAAVHAGQQVTGSQEGLSDVDSVAKQLDLLDITRNYHV